MSFLPPGVRQQASRSTLACRPVTSRAHASAPARRRSSPLLHSMQRTALSGRQLGGLLEAASQRAEVPRSRRWLTPVEPDNGGSEKPLEVEVEEEEEEGEEPVIAKVKVVAETKNKDLEGLLRSIDRGGINLDPRYQRQYVWAIGKACRLVESVFAKLFVPAVVLHTNCEGVDDVVDGKQRLSTLLFFKKGQFPDGAPFKLQGLKLLPQLNGRGYNDLPERGSFPSKKHFDDYSLPVTTFGDETSEEAVLRVYEDLNSGALVLTKQQVRRAVYIGPYIDLLERLSGDADFRRLLGRKGPDPSERDQEFVLHFFALFNVVHMFKGSIDKLLNSELSNHRHLSEDQVERMEEVFVKTAGLVLEVYGDTAFHRGSRRALSLGLYDCLMLTFAHVIEDKEAIKRVRVLKSELRGDLAELCQNEEFAKSFSPQRLRKRLDLYQRTLNRRLGSFTREFAMPEKLKAKLYEAQSGLCAACHHEIVSLEDAELDHKIPVAHGGTNDPSNAQLLHRVCNRAKAAKTGASQP